MPTKTSYSSPLTFQPTLGSAQDLASILGSASASAGTSAAAGKAIGTASKLAGKINPVTGVLMGAQLATTGIKEGMESVDALKQADPSATKGQKVGAALGGFGLGVANQLLGTDFQFKNKAIRDHEAKIDSFMTEKSSLTMKQKPIKALTQMQGTVAHNMSAKQYNKALQMKEISGAATMMTGDEKKGELTEKQKMEMDKQERPLYTMMRMPVRNVQKIQT
tara:strand:- start:61 stop:723 length:663 start_codon:yes stop_codon:yes gene_type:complete